MKDKIKKAFRIIIKAITAVILVAIAVVFILSKISGPVFLFGRTTMWVMTDSMSPTIHARSYILVEKATADDVEEGDIVAFISTDPQIAGKLNTHRVIKKDGNVFVTKGDGNPADDGQYSAKAENIVGKYVKTLPVMTFLGRIVLSEVGFVLIIFLLLIVAAFCYVPEIKEALQKKDSESEESKQERMDRLVQEELQKLIALRPLDAIKKEQEAKQQPSESENKKE